MSEYQMKPGKLGEKILNGYQKVEDRFVTTFLDEDGSLKTGGMAEKVTAAYQKVEDAVIGGYQKIEGSVVGGYKKIENAFVDAFLEKAEAASPGTGSASREKAAEGMQ